jgi:hypothetical protein
MRRGTRQRLIDGHSWDWVHRWTRRMFRMTRRSGKGKYIKRRLARRRRREPIERDEDEESEAVEESEAALKRRGLADAKCARRGSADAGVTGAER